MNRKTLILSAVVCILLIVSKLVIAAEPEQTGDGQLMTERERAEWFNQMLNTDVNGEKKKNGLQIRPKENSPSLLSERPARERSLTTNVEKMDPGRELESEQTHRY